MHHIDKCKKTGINYIYKEWVLCNGSHMNSGQEIPVRLSVARCCLNHETTDQHFHTKTPNTINMNLWKSQKSIEQNWTSYLKYNQSCLSCTWFSLYLLHSFCNTEHIPGYRCSFWRIIWKMLWVKRHSCWAAQIFVVTIKITQAGNNYFLFYSSSQELLKSLFHIIKFSGNKQIGVMPCEIMVTCPVRFSGECVAGSVWQN